MCLISTNDLEHFANGCSATVRKLYQVQSKWQIVRRKHAKISRHLPIIQAETLETLAEKTHQHDRGLVTVLPADRFGKCRSARQSKHEVCNCKMGLGLFCRIRVWLLKFLLFRRQEPGKKIKSHLCGTMQQAQGLKRSANGTMRPCCCDRWSGLWASRRLIQPFGWLLRPNFGENCAAKRDSRPSRPCRAAEQHPARPCHLYQAYTQGSIAWCSAQACPPFHKAKGPWPL